MIRNLYLENFKCFQSENVAFKDMTILTGTNASGKSSVIQALLLLESLGESDNRTIYDLSEVLGIEVGGPKTLVAQNIKDTGKECDFCMAVDDCEVQFYIDKENGLDLNVSMKQKMTLPRLNYLNAERVGPRMTYSAGGAKKIVPNGENAPYLIEYATNNGIIVPQNLMLDQQVRKFSSQVEAWMSTILGDVEIKVQVDVPKAQSEMRLGNDLTVEAVLPTLTGFGISYVLPIVVSGLMSAANENQILIVENPEAHLHPSAQSAIGKFLALVASTGTQVVVETHSEHVIDGARMQMMWMERTDCMLVNYFRHAESNMDIMKIHVKESGELEEWPDGFFDQKQIDLREMFKMRMKHGDKKYT